jgi:phenylalanyl-tRNA synthetase beta chain
VRFVAGGETFLHPRSAATLEWTAPGGSTVPLGVAGELHPRVAAAFDLPRAVFAFDLSFTALSEAARLVRGHAGVPRFPAVLRDLAVVVAGDVEARAVLEGVRAEPLVEDVTLFDVYKGAPIPEGKKNLAMAIRYRAADRTLTDAEADAAHGRIVDRLRGELSAELRG